MEFLFIVVLGEFSGTFIYKGIMKNTEMVIVITLTTILPTLYSNP